MQEAAEASPQAMISVAGLSESVLSGLCRDSCSSEQDVCQIANFLFPNGFTCSGSVGAIEALQKKAEATEGLMQARLLKTSGAFHTRLMQPAREKLLAALRGVESEMKPPRCDVYMNVTGAKITKSTPVSEIVPMLGDQLVGRVQWLQSMENMSKDGVTEFYECGPQKQLKAMMKRINPEAWKATTNVGV